MRLRAFITRFEGDAVGVYSLLSIEEDEEEGSDLSCPFVLPDTEDMPSPLVGIAF